MVDIHTDSLAAFWLTRCKTAYTQTYRMSVIERARGVVLKHFPSNSNPYTQLLPHEHASLNGKDTEVKLKLPVWTEAANLLLSAA